MAENYDDTPDQNPDSELFDNYAIFGDDVLFLDLIDQITENEKEGRDGSLGELLQHLNEQLEESDWIGSAVKVSGKLHLSNIAIEDTAFDRLGASAKGMMQGEDSHGRFLLADDLPMNLGIPDSNIYSNGTFDDEDVLKIKEQPHKSRVVFSFHTPAELAEAREDESAEYIYYESGDYIMYPEDIARIKFSRPSLEMVAHTLEVDYPELADSLHLSDSMPHNDRELLERLRNARIPRNSELPVDIRLGIGRLLYKQLKLDASVDYQIYLDGVLYAIADSGGFESKDEPKGMRIYGKIVSIDLLLAGDYWLPHLIVAELASGNQGYEGRLVPIASIEKIVNMRPRRKRFGKLAMLRFSEPSELYDYWSRFQEAELESETRATELSSDEMVEYTNDIGRLVEPYFDAARDLIVQPLTSEVAELLKVYNDHRRALDDDGRTPRSSDALNQLLEEGLADTRELNRGDLIEISGGLEVLHVTRTNTEPYKLEDGIALRGKFDGVVEAIFPSKASAKRPTTPYLSFVLTDSSVGEGDADYSMFKDGVVLVKISSVHRPLVAKLLPSSSTGFRISD
jgi:hypothetical protein